MRTAFILFLVSLWTVPWSKAAEYPIQLRRTARAGQEYQYSTRTHITQKGTTSLGPKTIQEQKSDFAFEFDARIKVLETDPKGQIRRMSFKVARCERVQGKTRKELLSTNTVVTASIQDGKPRFETNGTSLNLELQTTLTLVTGLGGDQVDDDELFGTKSPKKIGDSWPVNIDACVAMLRKQKLAVEKEEMHGQVSLDQLVKVGGTECLEISAKVFFKKFTSPIPIPPGFQTKQSFGSARFSGTYPTDMALGPLDASLTFSVEVIAQAKISGQAAGPSFKVTSGVVRSEKREYAK